MKGLAQHYVLSNGVLSKKNKTQEPLRVVRDVEVPDLLKRLHQDPLSGHFGIQATLLRAKSLYYWPRMQDDIRNFV